MTNHRYDYPNVTNIAWHPTDNLVSFTTSAGEVFIYKDFVAAEFASRLDDDLHPAPLLHDTLKETSGNARKLINGQKPLPQRQRRDSLDSLDDILPDDELDEDDFVVDDDGAGYALGVNGNGKRTSDYLDGVNGSDPKRRAGNAVWRPRLHEPFQPGSTPWRGNRRYLCRMQTRDFPTSANSFRSQLDWIRLDCRSGLTSHCNGRILRSRVSSRLPLHRSLSLRQGLLKYVL